MRLTSVLSLWNRLRNRRSEPPVALSTKAKGDRAEAAAARYLRRHGYRLLERNLRRRYGEVDLLALHRGCLVIVEVRSYGSGGFAPHQTLSQDKQRRLRRLATNIHKAPRFRELPLRIDLVEVFLDDRARPASFEIFEAIC